ARGPAVRPRGLRPEGTAGSTGHRQDREAAEEGRDERRGAEADRAAPLMSIRFSKMHGLGNDFAVLDRRAPNPALAADTIRRMADRRRGVGFDQLLTIEKPTRAGALFRYGVWNQDGSAAGQCGNGARCVVAWLHRNGEWPGGAVRLE